MPTRKPSAQFLAARLEKIREARRKFASERSVCLNNWSAADRAKFKKIDQLKQKVKRKIHQKHGL
jgi:hypothetical protein